MFGSHGTVARPVINLFDDSLNSNALNQISMIRLWVDMVQEMSI